MTGSEIYNAALALTGEPPTSQGDYDTAVVLGLLNIIICEVFPYNNIRREAAGMKPLDTIPTLVAMDDSPEYETALERECMPYGLAAHLMLSDDETGKAQFFNQKYEYSREALASAVLGEVKDVYGEDEY